MRSPLRLEHVPGVGLMLIGSKEGAMMKNFERWLDMHRKMLCYFGVCREFYGSVRK